MTTQIIPPVNPLRGIALKLASVLLFTIMASLLKSTAHLIPAGQQVFFRSLFAIPVILVWLAWRRELGSGLRTVSPMSHVWRGLVGTLAMGLSFWGVGLLPFPEWTALGYAAPLMVVVFAAMFLNERVGIYRLSMVMAGFAGVMIILYPRLGVVRDGLSVAETLGAVVTLGGAMFAALAQIFIRKMVQVEQTAAIVFWFSVTSTVLSLVTLPMGWVWPEPRIMAMLILAGLIGGAAQIMLTSAYRYADASLVAPFDYASMLLALLIGWFIFAEGASVPMMAGAGVIMASGIGIIWRERQLGIKRARQRKVSPRI
ncbi:MAG: DMT family transporter [Paracoccus sp. (in: a-proteobacteria)]|nr:DMT family transporter [Paracoccus sp. (in: a-proteobacteria)]